METTNEYSRIILENEKLTSEVNNIFIKSRKKKYNTIKYSEIKELVIGSWNYAAYVFYIFGLSVVGYGFTEKEKEVLGAIYKIPATQEEKVVYTIFGVLIIFLGIYFHLKYGKIKTLVVKHFEGKNKKTPIFISDNEKEIIELKRELENRVYKK